MNWLTMLKRSEELHQHRYHGFTIPKESPSLNSYNSILELFDKVRLGIVGVKYAPFERLKKAVKMALFYNFKLACS